MTKYLIQTNKTGTRHIEVDEHNLETLKKYSLLEDLADSNGIVGEDTLEKLKMNVRSILTSCPQEEAKDLLDLCSAIIYHDNMKAPGLKNLIKTYRNWMETKRLKEEQQPNE